MRYVAEESSSSDVELQCGLLRHGCAIVQHQASAIGRFRILPSSDWLLKEKCCPLVYEDVYEELVCEHPNRRGMNR
jgi:hypothetical protein